MSMVKELKKKRDVVLFSVVGLVYVIPIANLIWGQTGFLAGLTAFFFGAIASLVPFHNIKCPYCSQSLLEKTTEKGYKMVLADGAEHLSGLYARPDQAL